MLSLRPLKKLFKAKNLKKIGIGLGVAAAALVTGGAIMGVASGVGPAAGIASAAGKVGSALGISTAAAGPAGAATGAAGTAAAAVAPAAAATAAPSTAVTSGLGAGLAGTGGTLSASVLPAAAAPSAVPVSGIGATGSGLGAGASAFNFGAIANPVLNTSRAGQAAGALASPALSNVAPGARAQPTTPAAEARRPVGLAPGAEQQPQQPINFGNEMQNIEFGGGASGDQTSRFGLGGGLLQTARGAINTGADWFNNLNPMTQFALLRGIEGGLTEDPLVTADRLERKRFKSRRGPRFVNGRWVS